MAFFTLITLLKKSIIFNFIFSKQILRMKNKIKYIYLEYSRIYIFDTKTSKFINYSINMCWICIYIVVIKIILIIMKVLWLYEIMCVFYIPWIYCGGYNFLLMCVISWIKSMGSWMICWHISITRRKTNKIDEKKRFKKVI